MLIDVKPLATMALLAWMLTGCRGEQPTGSGITPLPNFAAYAEQLDPTGQEARRKAIADELNYYLKRHDVRDEGFDMVARYAETGGTALESYRPKQRPTTLGSASLRRVPRRGAALTCDSAGRYTYGYWDADTLRSGLRIDSLGTYAGQMDSRMMAQGHGAYRSVACIYYEGHWQDDQREGFGFEARADRLLAGQWKAGRFLGERMHYNSDRIYGIDISRYQHEQGRRRFGISWGQLRITHLGSKASKNVDGEVDYPVSFVFIKCTQGISIENRYYAADCQAARRNGIPVGAYHFFSTRQRAQDQAGYFLKHLSYKKGDLPPVLDVEPTDADIERMGGVEAMWRSIRTWMSMVEGKVGVRPILYVNQRFVNNYLPMAPDVKERHQVWIARYGEYKPDVRLAFWQLTDGGRVRGIQGAVDINVFNGYDGQWQDFLNPDETLLAGEQ